MRGLPNLKIFKQEFYGKNTVGTEYFYSQNSVYNKPTNCIVS